MWPVIAIVHRQRGLETIDALCVLSCINEDVRFFGQIVGSFYIKTF